MTRRLIPALLAIALVGVACSSASSGGHVASPTPSTSTGTNATPSPTTTDNTSQPSPKGLKAFYNQKLAWTSCHDGFQCATLSVPEDYSKPHGRALGIAVIRQPSSETHEGSLIVNPGGPGGSGVDFVAQSASTFSQLTDHFDLVSFDPRGVGESDPVRCVTSSQLDTFINQNPDPQTQADLSAVITQAKAFANACYAKNGNYLKHLGTIDEARDMDVLRAALGDSKLTYYGASYGTYLGAKYAQLFPHNIRALVLDGALNPDESVDQENLIQAKGFQVDLNDFLAQCVQASNCPLGNTVTAAHAELESLKATVTAHPEKTETGRVLGAGEFFEGVAAGLYEPSVWPDLWAVLGQVKEGLPAGLLLFADSLTGRNSDGSYSNEIESNLAINCIDRPSPKSIASYTTNAKAFAQQAPDFGAAIEYGTLPCAFWKVPPVEAPHPVHAPGAPPILVIGTTRDPATPYVWAQALAKQLDSGVLLTFNGDGHTAYIRHDSCVDTVVKNYIVDLTPPKVGTRCG